MKWNIELDSNEKMDLFVMNILISNLYKAGSVKPVIETKDDSKAEEAPTAEETPVIGETSTTEKKSTLIEPISAGASSVKTKKTKKEKKPAEITEDQLKTFSLRDLITVTESLDEIPKVVLKRICALIAKKHGIEAVTDIIYSFDKKRIDDFTPSERKDCFAALKVFDAEKGKKSEKAF